MALVHSSNALDNSRPQRSKMNDSIAIKYQRKTLRVSTRKLRNTLCAQVLIPETD